MRDGCLGVSILACGLWARAHRIDTHPQPSYRQPMTIQLTAEQESQLAQMADQTGRSADELAREALDRYLTEESSFRAAVQTGLDAADRGEFLTPAEAWARVERALKA